MIVMHKSWCGACKQLKPKFAASKSISDVSSEFVMVSAIDDEAPQADPAYAIDGGYIPRIIFADSNGKPYTEVFNESGNPRYKYFYSDPESIAKAMHAASKLFTDKKEDL